MKNGEIRIFVHCFWKCKMVLSLWKTGWCFLSSLNIELYHAEVSLLGINPKTLNRELYTHVLSSIICNNQNVETIQISVDGWKLRKCNTHAHMHRNVLSVKNEILADATWLNLKDIMLSEVSQAQRTNASFHSYEITRTARFMEAERRMVCARGWTDRRMGGNCLMGTEFYLVCKDEVLEMRVVNELHATEL